MKSIRFRESLHLFYRLLKIEPQSLFRFHSDNDVFCYSQHGNQHKMLVNHADPQFNRFPGIINLNLLVFVIQAPLIGPVHSVQDLHKCCFSRSILTKQCVDLAFLQFKIHILQSLYCTKCLSDLFHFNQTHGPHFLLL